MSGDDARVGVKPATGGETNDDTNGFAAIEILIDGSGVTPFGHRNNECKEDEAQRSEHISSRAMQRVQPV
jgi:hypothetical protein